MAQTDSTSSDSSNADTLKKENESLSLTNNTGKKKGLAQLLQSRGNMDFEIGFAFSDEKNPSKNDKALIDEILKRKDVMSVFPSDLKFMWSAQPEEVSEKIKKKAFILYACRVPEGGKARVNGSHIDKAQTGYDQNTVNQIIKRILSYGTIIGSSAIMREIIKKILNGY
jgi:hypothetical protein